MDQSRHTDRQAAQLLPCTDILIEKMPVFFLINGWPLVRFEFTSRTRARLGSRHSGTLGTMHGSRVDSRFYKRGGQRLPFSDVDLCLAVQGPKRHGDRECLAAADNERQGERLRILSRSSCWARFPMLPFALVSVFINQHNPGGQQVANGLPPVARTRSTGSARVKSIHHSCGVQMRRLRCHARATLVQ